MSGSSEEKKIYYRLTPCPAYDVEGMESWLSDLAEEGLFLTQDGFFCGFGFFEKDTPRRVKYRLQASEVPGGFFADNDEPDEEQQEITEAFGWEFVARRGEFYIYRSKEEEVRELNTDPKVQELSLKMVQKRQNTAIFNCVLWGLLYPIGKSKGAVLVPMLYMKTWFYLFTAVLLLWFFVSSVKAALYYAGLRKRLKDGKPLNREKNRKQKAWWYPAKVILQIALCFIWGCILLGNLGRTVLFEEKISLNEYVGNPPFATLVSLTSNGTYQPGKNGYYDTFIEWSDPIAPVNVLWEEYATIETQDGILRSGLWDVDYHEMAWEWMAKLVASDYMKLDKERDFEFLYELDLGIDYAAVYKDDIFFTRVILREGTKVVRGCFYEYHNEQEQYLTVEEWAKQLAESIKQ